MSFPDDEKIGCENFEGYKNNALLEIDLKTYEINILRGADIRFLNTINNASYTFKEKYFSCDESSINLYIDKSHQEDFNTETLKASLFAKKSLFISEIPLNNLNAVKPS